MIENLGFPRFCLGDKGIIKYVQDILANAFKLGFNLLTVIADSSNVLIRPLGFLFLLDRGNDAPRGTSSSHNILVRDGQKISLIDGEFATNLSSDQNLAPR